MGDLTLVEKCWVGTLVDVRHKVVVQDVTAADKDRWLFGLVCLESSATLVWPCVRRAIDGSPSPDVFFYDLSIKEEKPTFLSMFNAEQYIAQQVDWKCPAAQLREGRVAGGSVGIRLFPAGPTDSLRRVAARAAFWQLSRTQLASFATDWSVSLVGCNTLFSALERWRP